MSNLDKRHPVVIYPTSEGHASIMSISKLMELNDPSQVLASLIRRMAITDKELLGLCSVLPPDADPQVVACLCEEAWPKRNHLGAFEQGQFDTEGEYCSARKIILHDW